MAQLRQTEDVLLRMQRELSEALKKPVGERHWGMVIDVNRCVGCNACTVACKAENNTPPGVTYHIVIDEEIGSYPNVSRRFLARPCMQCENPPCVRVCPVGATYRRADGIVVIDYETCIGCRFCVTACPYGARSFDFGEFYTAGRTPSTALYELRANFEYGRPWKRSPNDRNSSPVGNARKCSFCLHRLENEMLPACITTCIARARYFGDLNSPQSLVAQQLSSSRMMRLKEELGTSPSVHYLL
ncbi:MAG: 4Fe-4S dicluster domain-containing protein [Chloroflexi bacterium]|nr:4Fe-4S dicluster domain-containing protein [Chloroflexota bacterium]